MNRYLLFVGHSPARREAFQTALVSHQYQHRYDSHFFETNDILTEYRLFIDAHAEEGPLWITFVVSDQAAVKLARGYYAFYKINPPHAVVLLFSDSHIPVNNADLNLFTCPYLLIHGEKNSKISQAILHHQMRYGDPTQEEILEKEKKIVDETLEWLERITDLGYAKEGMHARGFRIRPLRGLL
jgi:hypothetical protein